MTRVEIFQSLYNPNGVQRLNSGVLGRVPVASSAPFLGGCFGIVHGDWLGTKAGSTRLPALCLEGMQYCIVTTTNTGQTVISLALHDASARLCATLAVCLDINCLIPRSLREVVP
jgi:hypothetical protein